ncbi:MAG: hypothetical protein U0176_06575 [Bacteroidia bacterium]
MGLILGVLGVLLLIAGYTKYGFVLKMIFGKERVKGTGTKWLALYLYVAAGVLLFIALLLLLP